MTNRAPKPRVPTIENIMAKVGVLERRKEYLQRKLARNALDHQSDSSIVFDQNEVEALEGAICAFNYYYAMRTPELNPLLALANLTRAVKEHLHDNDHDHQLTRAVKKAQFILDELGF